MKKILFIVLALVVGIARADNENIVTSQKYVDDEMAKLQPQFDGLGNDKLMLYGTTGGAVTSRDIVTSLGTSTTADSIPTRGAINTALATKQNTVNGTAGWVMENTGTAGSVKAKPVYSTTDNYKTALVEAGDLNQIVIDAVNGELTTLPGIGWRINTSVTLPTLRDLYLPDGFTRLEYLESTGTQWIDTGISVSNNIGASIKYAFTEFFAYNDVFGIFNPHVYIGINSSGEYAIASFRDNNQVSSSEGSLSITNLQLDYPYTVNMNFYNSGIIEFVGLRQKNIIEHQFQSSKTLLLFSVVDSSSERYRGKAKIYYAKITNGDSLVRDFIPARRDSDGDIGMYDTVSNTFFTNAGTGEFIAGPVVGSNLSQNQ